MIFSVAILAGTGLLYAFLRGSLSHGIEQELTNRSTAILDMVRTSVNVSIRNRLRAVAEKNREIVAGFHARALRGEFSEAEAKRRARQVLGSQVVGRTGYLYCLDSQGVIRVHPVKENIGRNLSEHGFVQAQKRLREGYLEYFWKNPDEQTLRPKALYMTYFKPWDWIISASSYRDEFGTLVDVSDFQASILAQSFGESGYTVVMDSRGNVVVHPYLSGNILSQRDATGRYVFRELVTKKFGKMTYQWRHPDEQQAREKVVIFNYLPEVDWIVGATGYMDDFNAPLRYLRNMAFLAAPVVLLLGLPFSLWVGRSVSRPIESLRRSFALAAGGDFSTRIPEEGSSEMIRLGHYFNGFMEAMENKERIADQESVERLQAERREARLRRYLQDVVDAMPSIILGLDQDYVVTLWNKKAALEFDTPAQSAYGRFAVDVCPAWDVLKEPVAEAYSTGNAVVRDKLAGSRDGQVIYRSVEVWPMPMDRGMGLVVRISDVTQRVRMEEMMVQSEKMMSVGGLAAGMAHEINNPLGGILQGCQNIERRLSPDRPANQELASEVGCDLSRTREYMHKRGILRFLAGIRESGERAAKIVSNMLDFSRRQESRRAMRDIRDLLEKALELAGNDYDLKRQFDFRSIKIQRSFEQVLPQVTCSATEIEQVFLNLFRNAAQAMQEGDREPVLRISAWRDGDWVRVEVADNGPGMDETVRKRIFEPFFTTKEVGEGTGLGLAVSYFIITRNHSGVFTVDSSPDRGATFIIKLPL